MGNKIITPVNGVLFMNVVPVAAFAVSALSGIVLTPMQLAGAAITVAALVMNSLYQRRGFKGKCQSILAAANCRRRKPTRIALPPAIGLGSSTGKHLSCEYQQCRKWRASISPSSGQSLARNRQLRHEAERIDSRRIDDEAELKTSPHDVATDRRAQSQSK
jgi:hypothetical protein